MVDLKEIDRKWAQKWYEAKIFQVDPDERPKAFATFPFPYMNGPLHLGHAFTSTRVDVWARFKRMQGYNVLFPWAWHITGEPIAGAAKRVAEGDESQIRIFRDIDEVPEEEIKKFVDPEYMAKYYIQDSKKSLIELGHSIDWRREFTTTSLHEQFNRFIEWQYLTLRDMGYVKKGTHPVVWCPHDESPTGDHDRLKGEGVSPTEFVLLKFKYGDAFLPAATLRPETIFGVTNMWINPEAEYAEVEVDGEKWIVAKEAVLKLKEQKDSVKELRSFKGRELIGKNCEHPLTKEQVLILPASFVDPEAATGVVMSVPSHAPYDYIALKDLRQNPEILREFGINPEVVEKIEPISLIETPGYGEHPAIEIVESMGVENQEDVEKLEKATEIIYKNEFYRGILKENTGKYAGKKVSEAKKELISDFISQGIASKFYDLTEEVVCRCGTKCVVKILKDQWFLNYSNEEWKAKVREALSKMKIYPEEARANFENTIEWLEDKACARKTGLGTPLPWDKEWKVETLSDSTVYMAFYTIAKHINLHKIPGEKLSREVFDYIFYGKGSAEELGKKYEISPELLREMREEFEYWYPVDLRCSAKELIPNHLTFFIFHHVALFPDKLPRAIAVNGMMSIEGEKMSKSKGNFITLKQALRNYGASVTRCALLYASEGMRDPDWRSKSAKDMEAHLRGVLTLVRDSLEREFREEKLTIDLWLESRLQNHIKNTTEALEEMRTRTALQSALFDVLHDIKWYLRRDKPHEETLRYAIETWAKLFSPYAPAIAEEIWQILGNSDFISLSRWPEYREDKVNPEAEVAEEMLVQLISDVENIEKVAGIKAKRIILYTSPAWKWDVFERLCKMSREELRKAVSILMKEEAFRKRGKDVVALVNYYTKKPERLNFKARIDEEAVLQEAREFLERELKAKVEIYSAEAEDIYDPAGKSRNALPAKPAIYIE